MLLSLLVPLVVVSAVPAFAAATSTSAVVNDVDTNGIVSIGDVFTVVFDESYTSPDTATFTLTDAGADAQVIECDPADDGANPAHFDADCALSQTTASDDTLTVTVNNVPLLGSQLEYNADVTAVDGIVAASGGTLWDLSGGDVTFDVMAPLALDASVNEAAGTTAKQLDVGDVLTLVFDERMGAVVDGDTITVADGDGDTLVIECDGDNTVTGGNAEATCAPATTTVTDDTLTVNIDVAGIPGGSGDGVLAFDASVIGADGIADADGNDWDLGAFGQDVTFELPYIFSTVLSHDADGDGSWDAVNDVITVFWSAAATHASGNTALPVADVEAVLGADITYAAGLSTVTLGGSQTSSWTLTIGAAALTTGIDVGAATLGTDNPAVTDPAGNAQIPGSDVTLQAGMWPECGTPIGGVTVNSRCIQAGGFQVSTDGGTTWDSENPSDGGFAPAGGLDLDVFDTGLLQIQVVDDDLFLDPFELTGGLNPKLDAGDQVRIKLNAGDLDPVVLIGTGELADYTTTISGGGDTIVEIVATPSNASWVTGIQCNLAGFGGCGNDTTAADVDYAGMLTFAIDDLSQIGDPAFQAAARGTSIMTDAQTFAAPSWNPTTEAFEIDVAAPHLLNDGITVNTGEFSAFLPDGLFTDDFFGVDPASAVFTATANGSSVTASATVVTGGVQLELSGYSYSAPTIAITADEASPSTPDDEGDGSAEENAPAGGTVTTDPDGTGPTEEQPTTTGVTTPNAGTVTVETGTLAEGEEPVEEGFSFLGQKVVIEAPDATPDEPLVLDFGVDVSALPEASDPGTDLAVFRDGVVVPRCATPDSAVAEPDPCVRALTVDEEGDVSISVNTSQASTWTFAEAADATAACPAGVPEDGFADVGEASVHERTVDCVAWWDITVGRDDGTYGPTDTLTRAELASFVARVLIEAGVELPDGAANPFGDVADGSTHEADISALASIGVVLGKTDTVYAPTDPITRDEMATILVRAYEHAASGQLSGGGDAFTDDDASVHHDNINKAAAAGFTNGTSATTFDPSGQVTRGETASFLANTLDKLVDDGLASTPA